jgi:hypothetical protein|tara:strand:- start:290 stop:589 length:300 start_codon:yes stop_codon:yes gene_type:complete
LPVLSHAFPQLSVNCFTLLTGKAGTKASKIHSQLLLPEIQLDLVGIAKSYPVDQPAAVLRNYGVEQGLIYFGGDLRTLVLGNFQRDGISALEIQQIRRR